MIATYTSHRSRNIIFSDTCGASELRITTGILVLTNCLRAVLFLQCDDEIYATVFMRRYFFLHGVIHTPPWIFEGAAELRFFSSTLERLSQ